MKNDVKRDTYEDWIQKSGQKLTIFFDFRSAKLEHIRLLPSIIGSQCVPQQIRLLRIRIIRYLSRAVTAQRSYLLRSMPDDAILFDEIFHGLWSSVICSNGKFISIKRPFSFAHPKWTVQSWVEENMIWHFETSDNEHVNNSSPEMSVLYKLFYFAYLIISDRQKYKRDNDASSLRSRKLDGTNWKKSVLSLLSGCWAYSYF